MKKIFRMAAFMLALGSMTAGFTSCGDDDETDTDGNGETTFDEVVDATNFKIKANKEGTITFYGSVEANAKIKTFQLLAADGSVAYDFLEKNELVKEKNKVYDENGKATKEKLFKLDNIESEPIPVDLYTLVIKTKNTKNPVNTALGEVLEYTIGTGKSTTASYLSVIDNKSYDLATAKTVVDKIEVIAEGSNSVEGIKRASEAISSDINKSCGKVALFDKDGKAVASGAISAGGVIITESGCICKIKEIGSTDASSYDAKFSGITIKTVKDANGKVILAVDVPSDITYSK
jgi:hypothetical protein